MSHMKIRLDTNRDSLLECPTSRFERFASRSQGSLMTAPRMLPNIQYLREASAASLESFELSRLNHAANLRREIGALIDQWIQESSEALMARWLIEHRRSHGPSAGLPSDVLESFLDPAPPTALTSRSVPADDSHAQPVQLEEEILPAPPRYAVPHRTNTSLAQRKSVKNRSIA